MSEKHSNAARKACVFCGGQLHDADRAKQVARQCDLLLAADGGADHLARLSLKPHAIIGDMDSITPTLWAGDDAVLRIFHSPDKDHSDAELAVEYAFRQGCRQAVVVAGLGGRLDHVLANVALVAQHPGRVAIVDGPATLVAVDSSSKCLLHGPTGTVVSLIPYGRTAVRVRTAGLKYPLYDEGLAAVTQGLSNELIETHGCVCVSEGILLIYVESDQVCAVP